MNDENGGKDTERVVSQERLVPRLKPLRRGWWMGWALIMLAWCARELVIRRDIVRWQQYEKAAAAKGDDLGIDAWLPPEIPNDADNFARHPLVAELWSSADSRAAKELEGLKPLVAGTSGKDELPDASQAAKLLEDLKPAAGMLADLHTAALRSGCRLPFEPAKIFGAAFEKRTASFGMLGGLLFLHARASLVCGDQEAAVTDVETLLHGSVHFRSQRVLLLGIIAADWEKKALGVMQDGLGNHQWSTASRARLTAAFTGPEWPQAFCNILRLERGLYLRYFNRIPSSFVQSTAFGRFLFRMRYPVRRETPINKWVLCRSLEPLLASGGAPDSMEPLLEAERKSKAGDPHDGRWTGVIFLRYGIVYRLFLDVDDSAKKIMNELASAGTE